MCASARKCLCVSVCEEMFVRECVYVFPASVCTCGAFVHVRARRC